MLSSYDSKTTSYNYSQRLALLDLIPLSYWHDFLDMVVFYKLIHGLTRVDEHFLASPINVNNRRETRPFSFFRPLTFYPRHLTLDFLLSTLDKNLDSLCNLNTGFYATRPTPPAASVGTIVGTWAGSVGENPVFRLLFMSKVEKNVKGNKISIFLNKCKF